MKCPFCKKRIPKETDCPYCNKSVYEIKQKQSNNLSDKVTYITFGVLFAFLCSIGLFFFSIRYDMPRSRINKTYDSYDHVIDKYADDIIYIDKLYPLVTYRDELKDILDKLKYNNIEVLETVNVNNLTFSNASLTLSATSNNMQIKILITATHLDYHYLLSIAGSNEYENRQFEIKENEINEILDYLEFVDGYQLLLDGYNNMTLIEDNRYQYINNNNYNIILTNELYDNRYTYSYSISK